MNTQPYQGEEQDSQSSNHHRVTANSILVADCGSVFTKVSLLGIVEGQYRIMACGEAPTTQTAAGLMFSLQLSVLVARSASLCWVRRARCSIRSQRRRCRVCTQR